MTIKASSELVPQLLTMKTRSMKTQSITQQETSNSIKNQHSCTEASSDQSHELQSGFVKWLKCMNKNGRIKYTVSKKRANHPEHLLSEEQALEETL